MWGRQGKAGAQERLVPKLCETFSGRKRLTEVPFYPPVEFKFTDWELAGSHVTGKLEMMRWRTSPFRSSRLQPHRLLPPLPDAEPGDGSGRGPP